MLSSITRVARRSKSLTRASNLLCSVNTRKYHEKVLDHYENPRNVGRLDAKKQNVGTGLVGAPACGDVMKLQIEVGEDGKIIDAKFKTFGCSEFRLFEFFIASFWTDFGTFLDT